MILRKGVRGKTDRALSLGHESRCGVGHAETPIATARTATPSSGRYLRNYDTGCGRDPLRDRLTPSRRQNLAEWARLRPSFVCFTPGEDDAENAAALQRALRRQGWQLETVDAFIAVIALRYDLALLTSDNDFVPVPNLKQEN